MHKVSTVSGGGIAVVITTLFCLISIKTNPAPFVNTTGTSYTEYTLFFERNF